MTYTKSKRCRYCGDDRSDHRPDGTCCSKEHPRCRCRQYAPGPGRTRRVSPFAVQDDRTEAARVYASVATDYYARLRLSGLGKDVRLNTA
jgi:hypothetical protein